MFYATINKMPLIAARYPTLSGNLYDTGERGKQIGVGFSTREAAREAALTQFPNEYYGDPEKAIRIHTGPDSNRADSVRYAHILD